MKKLSLTLILLFFSFGCESFVENAISPISYVNDDDINTVKSIFEKTTAYLIGELTRLSTNPGF